MKKHTHKRGIKLPFIAYFSSASINYGGDQNNVMKTRDEDSWQKFRDEDRMKEKESSELS